MRAMKRSPCRAIVCSMRRMSTRSVPMPRIMTRSSARIAGAATPGRGLAHMLKAGREPGKDRFADEEMTDVELDNFGQRADRFGGQEVQAVPGVHLEAEPRRRRRARLDAGELGRGRRLIARRDRLA